MSLTRPLHSARHNIYSLTSIGVDIFFSEIFSYFWRFVAALRPCQGRLPRRKYIMTYLDRLRKREKLVKEVRGLLPPGMGSSLRSTFTSLTPATPYRLSGSAQCPGACCSMRTALCT